MVSDEILSLEQRFLTCQTYPHRSLKSASPSPASPCPSPTCGPFPEPHCTLTKPWSFRRKPHFVSLNKHTEMRKIRGFKLGKRLVRAARWIFRRTRTRKGYSQISPTSSKPKPISKLITWGRRLTNGARTLCCRKPGSGYVPVGYDPVEREKKVAVPKGHLAVYVGQQDGDFHRVLVPVIYFNHPLFGELLREAEEEYGHQHQGGITIPCRISDFERVKTRIAASGSGGGGARMLTWKRHY